MSIDDSEYQLLQGKIDEIAQLKVDIELLKHFFALLQKIRDDEKSHNLSAEQNPSPSAG